MVNDKIVLISISREDLQSLIGDAVRSEFSKKREKEILSGKEVCDLLHIHPSTLSSWKRENKIPYKRIGKRIFFEKAEVLAVMTESNYKKMESIK